MCQSATGFNTEGLVIILSNNNNNNNNNPDDVYGAVIVTESLPESSPGSSDVLLTEEII